MNSIYMDELRDTWVKVGCYRETWRLQRVLRVFHNSLLLAEQDGLGKEFSELVASLHDRKGVLTVEWIVEAETAMPVMRDYIDRSWEQEGEIIPPKHGLARQR